MQSPSECHSVFAIGVTRKRKPLCFTKTLLHPASATLKQQSTLWRIVVWWDKLFCTHFLGTKALKLRHSHITSPLTRFTVHVSSETKLKYPAFHPFLESMLLRVSAGARQGSSAGHAGGAQFLHKANQDVPLHSHSNDKWNLREVKSLIILLSHISGYYRSLHNIPRFNRETV